MTPTKTGKTIVFCAGPAYSPEERAGMEEIANMLESSGYITYLPHRDSIDNLVFMRMTEKTSPDCWVEPFREAVFALHLYQIVERCQCLVMNMNGRVPDEGGLFSTSLAFSTGKPLIIYKRDHRTAFHGGDNSMITGLSHSFSTVSRVDKIPAALGRAIKKISSYGENAYHINAMNVRHQRDLERGRKIWALLGSEESNPAAQENIYNKIIEIITNK